MHHGCHSLVQWQKFHRKVPIFFRVTRIPYYELASSHSSEDNRSKYYAVNCHTLSSFTETPLAPQPVLPITMTTLYTPNNPSPWSHHLMLWRCWLGGRKGIRLVKTEWWGAAMVICLERGADLHMAQLMPLPLTVSCFSKIQIGLTFLVPAHLGSSGRRAVKQVCACVCYGMWVNKTGTTHFNTSWLTSQQLQCRQTGSWVDNEVSYLALYDDVRGRWWVSVYAAVCGTAGGTRHLHDISQRQRIKHTYTRRGRKKEPIFFCVHRFWYLTETGKFFHTLGLSKVGL